MFEPLMLQELMVVDKQADFSSYLAKVYPLGHVSDVEH